MTRFRPLKRLGHGSMAEVHLADLRLPGGGAVRCALKRVLPALRTDPEVRRRFVEEAEISRRLDHPNTVRVLDADLDGEEPFIAFEHYEGPGVQELLDKLAGRPAPLGLVVAVAKDLAAALGHVHQLADGKGRPWGLVHRDVSPKNLLFHQGSLKLIDFGLAKGDRPRRTKTGAVLGPASYLAPEQARGLEADPRTDVFSAALVTYVLATGHHPFEAETEIEQLRLIERGRIKVPERLGVDLPPAFARVLVRALMREPSDRYLDGGELEQAVARARDELRALGLVDEGDARSDLAALGYGDLGAEVSDGDATLPENPVLDRTRTMEDEG